MADSDTELLTEHFGYPPVSLIDDIINSVNILAERALNSVEQGLLKQPPGALGFKKSTSSSSEGHKDPEEAARTEIESGTHQLETLLCTSIDRNFDKFELYVLRNILCVRPADVRDWIRLSHYEGLDFSRLPPTSEEDGGETRGDSDVPSLAGMNHLRRKLRESMRLNALLTAERERNAHLLDELADLVGSKTAGGRIKQEPQQPSSQTEEGTPSAQLRAEAAGNTAAEATAPFAFLQRRGDLTDAGTETPFSTNMAFTLSQMQALRALSTSLQTLGPDLEPSPAEQAAAQQQQQGQQEADGSNDLGEDDERTRTWRRERIEYVETAARRHLETVQGLELGRDGAVRDGEWQSEGRKIGRGEVEGLERVVTLLGRDPEAAGGGGGGGGGGDGSSRQTGDSANPERMDES